MYKGEVVLDCGLSLEGAFHECVHVALRLPVLAGALEVPTRNALALGLVYQMGYREDIASLSKAITQYKRPLYIFMIPFYSHNNLRALVSEKSKSHFSGLEYVNVHNVPQLLVGGPEFFLDESRGEAAEALPVNVHFHFSSTTGRLSMCPSWIVAILRVVAKIINKRQVTITRTSGSNQRDIAGFVHTLNNWLSKFRASAKHKLRAKACI